MQVEQINSILRELFNELIDDGYKKSNICSVTLGSSNVPQFDSFMKGTNFGIKPLQRIIENQGFDLRIVISPRENTEVIDFINNINIESLKKIKETILKILENETSIRAASVPKSGAITEVTNELFNEIVK